ncbi:hypothetical protein HDV04_005477 [Boothiomyces sp. JEL0838]|nr:hypothetical protein HDV04_005477 [Boothiomyces sp. JEL0838]
MQLVELEQKLQAMNDSKVESPTLSSTTLLDEKLSKIQDEIAKLTLVIPNLTNSVKQKEPQIDNFKVSMDETSGLSTTDTFKSFDSNSNLEGMLRRILKQKKVHYQDQKQNINYENDEDESSITEKSPKPISKEKREITVQVSSECQTEDPKPETVTAAIQTNELISKSVQTREFKQAKVVSEEKPIVKNTSNDQSSNSHPTCSSQYSWVCPGCANDTKISGNRSKVHERRPSILDEPIQNINTISLIPADESILFANDTSMVKSLVDVVSDLETETVMLGLAAHNILGSLGELFKKECRENTQVFVIGLFTWMALTTFTATQCILLDYMTSPYDVGLDFWGNVEFSVIFSSFFSVMGVTFLMISRLRSLYGRRSFTFPVLVALSFLLITTTGGAAVVGVYISYDIANNKYIRFQDHSLYSTFTTTLAISYSFQALVGIISTITFLGKGVVDEEDQNVVAIAGYKIKSDLPSFCYALQYYAFLEYTYRFPSSDEDLRGVSTYNKSSNYSGNYSTPAMSFDAQYSNGYSNQVVRQASESGTTFSLLTQNPTMMAPPRGKSPAPTRGTALEEFRRNRQASAETLNDQALVPPTAPYQTRYSTQNIFDTITRTDEPIFVSFPSAILEEPDSPPVVDNQRDSDNSEQNVRVSQFITSYNNY